MLINHFHFVVWIEQCDLVVQYHQLFQYIGHAHSLNTLLWYNICKVVFLSVFKDMQMSEREKGKYTFDFKM